MNSKGKEILKDYCITVFTVFFLFLSFFIRHVFSIRMRGRKRERKKILYTTINRIDPANIIYLRLFIRKFSLFEWTKALNGTEKKKFSTMINLEFSIPRINYIHNLSIRESLGKASIFFLLVFKFSFRMDLISIEIMSEREFSSFRPSHPSFLSTQTDDIKVWNLTRWHREKFSTTINRNPPPLPLEFFLHKSFITFRNLFHRWRKFTRNTDSSYSSFSSFSLPLSLGAELQVSPPSPTHLPPFLLRARTSIKRSW